MGTLRKLNWELSGEVVGTNIELPKIGARRQLLRDLSGEVIVMQSQNL